MVCPRTGLSASIRPIHGIVMDILRVVLSVDAYPSSTVRWRRSRDVDGGLTLSSTAAGVPMEYSSGVLHRNEMPLHVLQAVTQKLHRCANLIRYLYAPNLLDPPTSMLNPATT